MKSVDRETIELEAGEKVEIYSRRFSSVPITIEFEAVAKNDNQLLGDVEIHCYGLMFNQPNKVIVLEAYNQV